MTRLYRDEDKFCLVEMEVRDCELDQYGLVSSDVYVDYLENGRQHYNMGCASASRSIITSPLFFFVFTWILSSSGSVCFEARHRQRFDRTNRQRSGTLRAETQLLHASEGTQRQRARIAGRDEMRTRWMDAPPDYLSTRL